MYLHGWNTRRCKTVWCSLPFWPTGWDNLWNALRFLEERYWRRRIIAIARTCCWQAADFHCDYGGTKWSSTFIAEAPERIWVWDFQNFALPREGNIWYLFSPFHRGVASGSTLRNVGLDNSFIPESTFREFGHGHAAWSARRCLQLSAEWKRGVVRSFSTTISGVEENYWYFCSPASIGQRGGGDPRLA